MADKAKLLDRNRLGAIGIALAIVLFFAVNILAGALLKSTRLDLTEDKLFTLSDGTKRVLSTMEEPVDLRVRVEAGSDFADLFDVKNNTPKKGIVVSRVEDGELVLAYQREDFRRETVIRADQPAQIDEQGLTFLAHVEPHQRWSVELQVTPIILRRGRPEPLVAGWRAGRANRDRQKGRPGPPRGGAVPVACSG